MKRTFSILAAALLLAAAGCRSNPVNRLLGMDDKSSSGGVSAQGNPGGILPATKGLLLLTDKTAYQVGETVNIELKNVTVQTLTAGVGPSLITLRDSNHNPILLNSAQFVRLVTLAPGQIVVVLGWNQQADGKQVPAGKYYADGYGQEVSFTIGNVIQKFPVEILSIREIEGGAMIIPLPGQPPVPNVRTEPLPNATFVGSNENGYVMHGITNADGVADLDLPAGRWTFKIDSTQMQPPFMIPLDPDTQSVPGIADPSVQKQTFHVGYKILAP